MAADSRPRTIITQDAEVDDQNSLRHFLLYTNEVELQGIVQTSSVFHWIGIKGAQTPEPKAGRPGDPGFVPEIHPYDAPYRWPGTDWMFKAVDDYASVYPNLQRQDARYPAPEVLKSLICVGNIGYPGEMLHETEGSRLILETALDRDPRPLYLQAWGGTNTIARALYDIQQKYGTTDGWETLHRRLSDKIIITACGEQDTTYRSYIAEEWPDIQFVTCMSMGYGYGWSMMPPCDSLDCLRAAFMKEHIATGKGALLDGYALWADGKYYEGEEESSQFGSNPSLLEHYWGTELGLKPCHPYDFLSEGDSPTFFFLLDWGLRTRENFAWGGFSGRYAKADMTSTKGHRLNYWQPQQDTFTDRNGNTTVTDSAWRYVADIQRDMAARADWCAAPENTVCEHAPELVIEGGLDRAARPGETVGLLAQATNPDGCRVNVTYRIYPEASSLQGAVLTADGPEAAVKIPEDACPGSILHVIIRAENQAGLHLAHYQQLIITII